MSKTLTEMLKVILPDEDEPELKPIKEAIKEWLRTVALPDDWTIIVPGSKVEATRRLLIALVDEP